MRRLGRTGCGAAAALVLGLGLVPGPAHAGLLPGIRLTGSIGHTSAIASVPKDFNAAYAGRVQPPEGSTVDWETLSDRGGRSLRLALMAPLSHRVSVGVEGATDDLFSIIVATRDGTGELSDANPVIHRSTWSLGWRADADVWTLPSAKSWRLPASTLVATGTAGVWRVTTDRLLRRLDENDAFGWSLGMGWNFQLPAGIALGPAVRYARVFEDGVGRYVTASLDWNWR